MNTVSAQSPFSYFDLVNEAELLICDSNYPAALEHYDKAFQLKENPFGKDVYNAWIASFIIDDEARYKTYSSNLIKHGAFANDQVTNNLLSQIENGPKKDRYSKIYLELKAKIKLEIDTVYYNQLATLLTEDQKQRKHFSDIYGAQYNIGGRDALNTFDSLNVLKLINLIKQKGFPTEAKVGYSKNFPTNPPIYSVVLAHDRSWTNRETLDSLLHDKVLSGDFPAMEYADLKNLSYESFHDSAARYQQYKYVNYGLNKFYIIDGSLYIIRLSNKDTTVYDPARKELHMDSVKEMCIKGEFQFHNQNFQLISPLLYRQYTGLPKDVEDKIKNKWSFKKGETDGFNTISAKRCKYGLHH
jgi:hypothetical protein